MTKKSILFFSLLILVSSGLEASAAKVYQNYSFFALDQERNLMYANTIMALQTDQKYKAKDLRTGHISQGYVFKAAVAKKNDALIKDFFDNINYFGNDDKFIFYIAEPEVIQTILDNDIFFKSFNQFKDEKYAEGGLFKEMPWQSDEETKNNPIKWQPDEEDEKNAKNELKEKLSDIAKLFVANNDRTAVFDKNFKRFLLCYTTIIHHEELSLAWETAPDGSIISGTMLTSNDYWHQADSMKKFYDQLQSPPFIIQPAHVTIQPAQEEQKPKKASTAWPQIKKWLMGIGATIGTIGLVTALRLYFYHKKKRFSWFGS